MKREDCEALDRADKLATVRDRFDLPDGVIYLDGNSLGPLPYSVTKRLKEVVEGEWGIDLIRSWNHNDWINLPFVTGEKIAKLIGAAPGQVICTDSTSINLFKLLVTGLGLNAPKTVLLSSHTNFPTDLYMAQGLGGLLGDGRCQLRLVSDSEIESALTDDVAVLFLTHVDFRSGNLHNMQHLTNLAHEQGALVLWDLSHSVGAVPINLDEWQVDLAVGCGYKFLNGGPGAPAFLYVATRHLPQATQPLSGWMGHADPFAFAPEYRPASGIASFASGTPGILGMAALDVALGQWHDINVADVRAKSLSLCRLFYQLVSQEPMLEALCPVGTTLLDQRGSQVCFSHPDAYAIVQALVARQVIGDFRAPDIMRFGIAPLYVRHVDVFDAVRHLCEVVSSEEFKAPAFQNKTAVT